MTKNELLRSIINNTSATEEHIFGKSKLESHLFYRWMFCFIAYNYLKERKTDIARYIGRKQHGTIINAIMKFPQLYKARPDLHPEVDRLVFQIATDYGVDASDIIFNGRNVKTILLKGYERVNPNKVRLDKKKYLIINGVVFVKDDENDNSTTVL